MPKAVFAAKSHDFGNWLAHTVHWGDFPTWATAVGAAVAAVYAGRAFGAQRQQLTDLGDRQALTDRLLSYQALQVARTFTEDLEFVFTHAANFAEYSAVLKNGSKWNIADVKIVTAVDNTKLDPVAQYQQLNQRNTGWLQQEGDALPPLQPVTILKPGTGRSWTWKPVDASAEPTVEFALRFTDEVGGRWEYDQEGRIQLVEDPTW